MLIPFTLACAALAAGSAFLYAEVKNAPEGEETENGFEITWRNDRADAANVSCVWKVLGGDTLDLPTVA